MRKTGVLLTRGLTFGQIAEMAEFLDEDKEMQVCILGPSEDDKGIAQAVWVREYFMQNYPLLAGRVWMVTGGSGDLVASLIFLQKEIDQRNLKEEVVFAIVSQSTCCYYRVYPTKEEPICRPVQYDSPESAQLSSLAMLFTVNCLNRIIPRPRFRTTQVGR